jgi:hypothetical protein
MKTIYPSRLLTFITILSLFAVHTSAAPTSFAEVEESWQRGLSEVISSFPFYPLLFFQRPTLLPHPIQRYLLYTTSATFSSLDTTNLITNVHMKTTE